MRKHLSVLSLWWSMSWRVLLGTIIGMALWEGQVFARNWQALAGTGELSLDRLLSPMGRSVFIGFLLLFASLTGLGFQRRSRVQYTLDRLRVRPESAAMWHWACIALCLLILWAAQAAILLALCAVYCHLADPALLSEQTVFLAVYRLDCLHQLLPLEAVSGWVRNVAVGLALSLAGAWAAYRQRQKSKLPYILVILLASLTWGGNLYQNTSEPYRNLVFILFSLLAILILLLFLNLKEGGSEDDAEDA